MKRGLYILFLTLSAPGTVTAQERQPPVDWLRPCQLQNVEAEAWCGTYAVYEDRDARRGRKIDLNVAVIPTESPRPEPDPIFFLAGGPGESAVELAGYARWVLQHAHESRDIVLVDQRGTGRSNRLDCDEEVDDPTLQRFFTEFLEIDYVNACSEKLRATADLSLYSTSIAMDDFDEVREALGYRQINLMGGSYGTRAEQVYLRRHSEHVRSAVLKGVVPTNMKNPLPFARALERGLQGVFDACAVEMECHAEYPNIEDDWRKVLAQFEEGWVTADVTHPQTSVKETVTIPRGVFMDGIRHMLYGWRLGRHVPRVINAAAQGDFAVFAQHEIDQYIDFESSLSDGMFIATTCSEDVRFIREDEIEAATQGTALGDYRVRRQIAACSHWDLADVPESYTDPVRVDTPVLLLSGVYDTATPYEGAAWVARYLPHSLHVIVPNESHYYANPECEFKLISDFFQRGSVEGLDTSCVHETKRPPFVIGDTVP